MTRLDEIRARCEAATPGPWYEHLDYKDGKRKGSLVAAVAPGHAVLTRAGGGTYPAADLRFIAHAREDIPALLALAEAAGRVHTLYAEEGLVNVREMRLLGEALRALEGGQ